jgi:predicted site-specific integrase-resolvase
LRLSDWAKKAGVHYVTAYRWFRSGVLSVPAQPLKTGTILVFPPEGDTPKSGYAVYARVSSADQKADLDRQVTRVSQALTKQGWTVSKVVTEIGSGLGGHRRRLATLLWDGGIQGIAVEHRDRAVRFGSEYLGAALSASGRSLFVVDSGELKDDLVQDMIDVLTSFCVRLYGRRSAKNRAERAMKAAAR